jgi:hypothetical protein
MIDLKKLQKELHPYEIIYHENPKPKKEIINTSVKNTLLTKSQLDLIESIKKDLNFSDFEIVSSDEYFQDQVSLDVDYENRVSMLLWEMFDNIEECLVDVVKNNIEGDFIECGVWRGGGSIYAYHVLQNLKSDKKVWVADSFNGAPEPYLYPEDQQDKHYLEDLIVSLDDVKNNFKKFNALDADKVIFVEGLFRDSLPKCDIEKISVLRLDGDTYEATIESLHYLYSKLSIGGYCIIDDYGIPGCVLAVKKFRKKHNIVDEMMPCIDPEKLPPGVGCSAVYWKKTTPVEI